MVALVIGVGSARCSIIHLLNAITFDTLRTLMEDRKAGVRAGIISHLQISP